MSYTKGKWEINYSNYGNGGYSEWYEILVNGERIAKVGESRELTAKDKANAQLIASAPALYEACKHLPEPKSILAEAAYTGGDVPKKWITKRGNFINGYNQALEDVAKHFQQALEKTEVK